MRTVSFSAIGVQELLDEKFVCLRLNTRGDPSSGESFSHLPHDPAGPCVRGNGQQNVQVLFLTSSGEIFHVLTGFVGPDDLQSELEFALATYGKLSHEEDRRAAVRDAHTSFLRQAGFSEEEIKGAANDPAVLSAGITAGLPVSADGRLSFDGAFERLARSHVLADHQFAIDHPLLTITSLKPATLVGNGRSFFGSTSFGNRVKR